MADREPIYLDYNATTPVDPRVLQAMLPYFSEVYGNPANGLHRQGRLAARAVDEARERVADLIGAQPHEIVFTAGATESNNLAIEGLTRRADSGPAVPVAASSRRPWSTRRCWSLAGGWGARAGTWWCCRSIEMVSWT